MRMFIFAEYSDLFGKHDPNILKELITALDFQYTCAVLSELGYTDHRSDSIYLRKLLFKIFPKIDISKNRRYLQDDVIVTRHGVLLAWQYLFAHKEDCKGDPNDEKSQLGSLLKLILVMQENYMDQKEELNGISGYAIANAAFNYYDNQSGQAARAFFLFIKNKKQETPFWENMEKRFLEKYGFVLEDYIYLSYIIASYLNNFMTYIRERGCYFQMHWGIDPDRMPAFRNECKEELVRFLDEFSFCEKEGCYECNNTDSAFMPMLFMNKPLLKIGEKRYLPIEHRLVDDLIFNSLFHKINSCFDRTAEFMNEFGHMFQDYVDYIVKNTCGMSEDKLKYIPEFHYGKRRKDSSDVMILHEKDGERAVLVIEVKSARILYETIHYTDVSEKVIRQSIHKVVEVPLHQAAGAVSTVVKEKICDNLDEKVNYYILAVTMNNFPCSYYDTEKTYGEISKQYSHLKIRSCNAVSIEELELLLQVLAFPGGASFEDFIDAYNQSRAWGDSFKNFLKKYPAQKNFRNPVAVVNHLDVAGKDFQVDSVTDLSDEMMLRLFDRFLYRDVYVADEQELYPHR